MKEHIETTRRQLGELGAMSHQTDAMERKILARAENLLSEVEIRIENARASALTEPRTYLDLVEERGRLQQVIATAKAVLGQ